MDDFIRECFLFVTHFMEHSKCCVMYSLSHKIEWHWQGSSKKEVILGYNKNYTTLALKYTLKSSKGSLSVLEINRRYRNNNIENNNIENN